jgi:hypothetical protein
LIDIPFPDPVSPRASGERWGPKRSPEARG